MNIYSITGSPNAINKARKLLKSVGVLLKSDQTTKIVFICDINDFKKMYDALVAFGISFENSKDLNVKNEILTNEQPAEITILKPKKDKKTKK